MRGSTAASSIRNAPSTSPRQFRICRAAQFSERSQFGWIGQRRYDDCLGDRLRSITLQNVIGVA